MVRPCYRVGVALNASEFPEVSPPDKELGLIFQLFRLRTVVSGCQHKLTAVTYYNDNGNVYILSEKRNLRCKLTLLKTLAGRQAVSESALITPEFA